MKFFSVVAVAALALVATTDRAAGAACSVDDAKTMTKLLAKILASDDCLKSTGDCPNAECMKIMEEVYAGLPECTADGKNPKSEFGDQLKKCGSSTNSAASGFTRSAAVALTSAAVAVAAVYL